jgi:hypothetical protein
MRKVEFIGKKFHRLTVIEETRSKRNRRAWKCICICKNIKILETSLLSRTKSCGCLRDELIGKRRRKSFGESAKNRLIAVYKKGAKRRKIEWNLSDEEFFKIIQEPCNYCGIEKNNNTKKISKHSYGHINFTGIDRIDNTKGYLYNNCVPCCRQCNMAKYIFTQKEFKEWIRRLVYFETSRNI